MFLEKYQNYLNYYKLNEATDEELILVNFTSSIKPIRTFINQHVQDFQINNYSNLNIFQYISKKQRIAYAKKNMKLNQSVLSGCNVTCDVSQHAIYNYLTREAFDNIQKLFDDNNEKKFNIHFNLNSIKTTDSINSKNINLRKTFSDYDIDQSILDNILSNMTEAIDKYKNLIPKAILKTLTSKKYGINIFGDSDLKIILDISQITIGVFVSKNSSNSFELKISNVYKTDSLDYNTTQHQLIVIDDM